MPKIFFISELGLLKADYLICPFYFQLNVLLAQLALYRIDHIFIPLVLLFLNFFLDDLDCPLLKALVVNVFHSARAVTGDDQWKSLL
jgi:hypothetical protein